jgi:hypothetical protein
VAAVVAARAAVDTLEQVRLQSASTEKAANAAKENADALMKAECAYVLIEGAIKPKIEFPYPSFQYTLVNLGKTPAIIIESYGTLQVGKSTDSRPPDASAYDPSKVPFPLLVPVAIPSGNSVQRSTEGSGGREIEPDERVGILVAPHKLCFWACGFFIYLDVFGREYEQRFCYRYLRLNYTGFFCADGPEEYRQRFTRETRTHFPRPRPETQTRTD